MTIVSTRLADIVSRQFGHDIPADSLIVDAPPAEREVEFRIQVREQAPGSAQPAWRGLEDLSPVVRSLAREQFDSLVKRVRVFAPAHDATRLASCPNLEAFLLEAAGE